MFQRAQNGLLNPFIEKRKVFQTVVEHITNRKLQKFFRQDHGVFEVIEGHFRLDHPEFRQVARRIAVVSAKRGAERVDLRKRQGKYLAFQLAADS